MTSIVKIHPMELHSPPAKVSRFSRFLPVFSGFSSTLVIFRRLPAVMARQHTTIRMSRSRLSKSRSPSRCALFFESFLLHDRALPHVLCSKQHYKVHASASGEQSYWWQQRRLQKTMPDGAWYIALFGLAAVISGLKLCLVIF